MVGDHEVHKDGTFERNEGGDPEGPPVVVPEHIRRQKPVDSQIHQRSDPARQREHDKFDQNFLKTASHAMLRELQRYKNVGFVTIL